MDSVGEASVKNLHFQAGNLADWTEFGGLSKCSPSHILNVGDPNTEGLCQENFCVWLRNSKSVSSVFIHTEQYTFLKDFYVALGKMCLSCSNRWILITVF